MGLSILAKMAPNYKGQEYVVIPLHGRFKSELGQHKTFQCLSLEST
jgi:hypothetical protein